MILVSDEPSFLFCHVSRRLLEREYGKVAIFSRLKRQQGTWQGRGVGPSACWRSETCVYRDRGRDVPFALEWNHAFLSILFCVWSLRFRHDFEYVVGCKNADKVSSANQNTISHHMKWGGKDRFWNQTLSACCSTSRWVPPRVTTLFFLDTFFFGEV